MPSVCKSLPSTVPEVSIFPAMFIFENDPVPDADIFPVPIDDPSLSVPTNNDASGTCTGLFVIPCISIPFPLEIY